MRGSHNGVDQTCWIRDLGLKVASAIPRSGCRLALLSPPRAPYPRPLAGCYAAPSQSNRIPVNHSTTVKQSSIHDYPSLACICCVDSAAAQTQVDACKTPPKARGASSLSSSSQQRRPLAQRSPAIEPGSGGEVPSFASAALQRHTDHPTAANPPSLQSVIIGSIAEPPLTRLPPPQAATSMHLNDLAWCRR